jgi:molybdenum cofactor cytidylyltransferase
LVQASHKNSSISAVVLAAGLSSRMNRPKPLIRIGGVPMLESVLRTLTQSEVDEIVVVLGHEADAVLDQIDFGSARTVLNSAYKQGMASSLRVGLASLSDRSEAALIALADQPFFRPATVNTLIEAHRQDTRNIMIPVYGSDRGNPVLIPRAFFNEAEELRADVGFRSIFGKHPERIRLVPVDDPGILIDLDTPEDVSGTAAG